MYYVLGVRRVITTSNFSTYISTWISTVSYVLYNALKYQSFETLFIPDPALTVLMKMSIFLASLHPRLVITGQGFESKLNSIANCLQNFCMSRFGTHVFSFIVYDWFPQAERTSWDECVWREYLHLGFKKPSVSHSGKSKITEISHNIIIHETPQSYFQFLLDTTLLLPIASAEQHQHVTNKQQQW